MMEKILPSTKSKMKILRHVYNKPGTNISETIEKTKVSPNTVVDYVNALVEYGILEEKRIGTKKKTHVRFLYPNHKFNLSIQMFSLVEIDKRSRFLEKYTDLKPIIEQLRDLFEDKIEFVLVYGSYARFAAEKTSDLDMLIVGKLSEKTKERISEVFITFDGELSVKIESLEKFRKRIEEPLHQNIIRDHVVISGEINYVKEIFS